MTVMLVDDEKMALDDLIALIPWKEHGYEIVATATNGLMALDLYKKYRPNIIIVDINMPVINGLELSKQILATKDHVKIILLSAYKDFNYAKEAIDIGVCKYMVKHEINEISLLEELNKVRGEWEREENNITMLKDEMIRSILRGNQASETGSMFSNLHKYGNDLALFSIQKCNPFLVSYNQTDSNNIIVKNIERPDFESTEKFPCISCIEVSDGHWVIVYSMRGLHSEQKKWEQIRRVAQKIHETYENINDYRVKVAVNTTSEGFRALPDMLAEASRVIKYSIFMPKEKILRVQELLQFCSKEGITQSLKNECEGLIEDLRRGKLENSLERIKAIFDKIKTPPWSLNCLKEVCTRLLDILDQYYRECGMVTATTLVQRWRVDQYYWYTLDNIAQWFINQFSECTRFISDSREHKYSRKIMTALDYIHRNYKEDLTLGKLASKLDISPIYLSQLFKKELNKTFLEYLTFYRIEEAKRLISNSNLTMYQIAEMTGFRTSQYFSYVFKRVTGMSPVEYRESKEYML